MERRVSPFPAEQIVDKSAPKLLLNRVLKRFFYGISALVIAATNTACQPDTFTFAPHVRSDKNRYIILNQVEILGIHPTISVNCGKDSSVPSPREQIQTILDSLNKSGVDQNGPYPAGLKLLMNSDKLAEICND